MRVDEWHLTEDVDGFLTGAGDFLHSRPALHTLLLTVTEVLRARGASAKGADAPVFGRLEEAGDVSAAFFRTPPRRLNLTELTVDQADALAGRLSHLGHRLPGVTAVHHTAVAFAEAWGRHTGAVPVLGQRRRLYRLGTLTPPEPAPEGRSRVAGGQDQERLAEWNDDFAAAIGDADATRSAGKHAGYRRFTFWETPDGTPVSMAAVTPMVAGQVRVGSVYTPAELRGRGYASAVTTEVSRAALAGGAAEVVLFTDLANPTSNAVYQRIGYRPVADFASFDFA
ncbi:GNAT family N-acetyltransferase [Streptomyces sp. NPDC058691]|uniref:GNAT family N-acetyltransferase n=1 Tax=Streptomyces sp. NPDC058691 TaxID=3346601 RepID=UPI003655900F